MTVCRCRGLLEVRVRAGYDVKLDPTPLTALDELRAALAGTHTYSLRTLSGDVYWRSPSKIRSEPAGSHRWVQVHRAHDCTPTRSADPGPLADPTPARTPLGGTVGR